MSLSRQELLGVAAAAASSAIGGSSVVATRYVIAATDPATLGVLRYGIGAVCLVPLVLWAGLRWPRGRDGVMVALLGVLFFTVFPWFFNKALSLTTAAHGSLALSTLPFLTLLVAAALGAERLTGRKAAGVLLAMLGVGFALSGRLGGGMPEGFWRGDLLMIGAALCGAVYNALSRPYLRRYPALSYTAGGMMAGTIGMLLLSATTGAPERVLAFGGPEWAAALFLGVAGAALTFWLWSYGLEHTTPTRVAITVTVNPMVSLLLATYLLGEPWGASLLLGLAAVILGILLVNLEPRRP